MNFIPAVSINSYEGLRNYDLFSLLLKERIILITGEINDELANIVIAEILYLNALSKEQITIYINSPGGSVSSGLALYDIIQNSSAPISTIGIGMCASMGAIILLSGKEGLRYAYKNTQIMIHQPLGGIDGQISDIEIMTKQYINLKDVINNIIAKHTLQDIKKIIKDTDRNYFMNAEEAKEYHIIDNIKE